MEDKPTPEILEGKNQFLYVLREEDKLAESRIFINGGKGLEIYLTAIEEALRITDLPPQVGLTKLYRRGLLKRHNVTVMRAPKIARHCLSSKWDRYKCLNKSAERRKLNSSELFKGLAFFVCAHVLMNSTFVKGLLSKLRSTYKSSVQEDIGFVQCAMCVGMYMSGMTPSGCSLAVTLALYFGGKETSRFLSNTRTKLFDISVSGLRMSSLLNQCGREFVGAGVAFSRVLARSSRGSMHKGSSLKEHFIQREST